MTNEPLPPGEDDIRQRLSAREYRAAFELVVERFKDRVFRLAWSMLRDQTHAEDMTQDVFMKIWKALPGFNGEASLSTWIYTITRNTALTELKRRRNRPTVSLDGPEFESAGENLPALQTVDAIPGAGLDVHAILAELPGKYRPVITLFYLEQRKYEELSALLGLPLGTVKTLLFRARKELVKIAARHRTLLSHP